MLGRRAVAGDPEDLAVALGGDEQLAAGPEGQAEGPLGIATSHLRHLPLRAHPQYAPAAGVGDVQVPAVGECQPDRSAQTGRVDAAAAAAAEDVHGALVGGGDEDVTGPVDGDAGRAVGEPAARQAVADHGLLPGRDGADVAAVTRHDEDLAAATRDAGGRQDVGSGEILRSLRTGGGGRRDRHGEGGGQRQGEQGGDGAAGRTGDGELHGPAA